MAIKTKTARDTYRSNVKIRPLRQNGLEAQYQGLDITEVNIDHAGLAIIGQGGYQTRRDIIDVKVSFCRPVYAVFGGPHNLPQIPNSLPAISMAAKEAKNNEFSQQVFAAKNDFCCH